MMGMPGSAPLMSLDRSEIDKAKATLRATRGANGMSPMAGYVPPHLRSKGSPGGGASPMAGYVPPHLRPKGSPGGTPAKSKFTMRGFGSPQTPKGLHPNLALLAPASESPAGGPRESRTPPPRKASKRSRKVTSETPPGEATPTGGAEEAKTATSLSPRTGGPPSKIFAGEEAFFRSLGHMRGDLEAGPGTCELDWLRDLSVCSNVGTHLAMKRRRDQLQAALREQLDSPSVYTLHWAAGVIKNRAAAASGGEAAGKYFSTLGLEGLVMLTIMLQIFVPLALVLDSKTALRLPFLACPRLFLPNAFRDRWFRELVYGVTVYLMCFLSCLTNYGSVHYEEQCYRFLAKHRTDA